jgi:GWxTD domain-containing protein
MTAKCLIFSALIFVSAVLRSFAGSALDIDHACFRGDDSLGYVEVFTAIQRSSLTYQAAADSQLAAFRVVLQVSRNQQIEMSDTFRAEDVMDTADGRAAPGQFFAHIFQLAMKPGTYGLRAILGQSDSITLATATDTVIVPVFSPDSLIVSDIELGSRMEFTSEPSPMSKNGVLIVPNPTRFFGTQLPLFNYYAEVYGLDFDSAAIDSYAVTRRVLDAESGIAARVENTKIRKAIGTTAVMADGFPVATLRTGTYLLELEVKSLRSGRSAISRKKFWTYRKEDYAGGRTVKTDPGYQARLQSGTTNIVEVVNPDSALQWMKYILTKNEQDRTSRLVPDGKRAFLREYWAAGWSPSWRTQPLLADDYFARVVEANQRYTFLKRPGWKTDRGRVFIMYGEPDRVDRNYGTASDSDNERWEYDKLEGGCYFIFADKRGYGDLDMVHSTKRGELYNPNWSNNLPNPNGQSIGH